ncbi:MAG: hypothetical protein J1E96_01045 [Ruminococcus sp.]|nr:hypothetical protein [Ruminococcus sp.]
MDRLLFKRIIIALLSVLILSYLVYLFVSANFSRAVEVEEAVYSKVSDVIYSDAYLIRNEEYITNNSSGVLSFNVSNGNNVSAGQTIADIYRNETDAVYRQQIENVNNQIKSLRTLSESYYKDSISIDAISTQINNNIYSILSDVNSGKLSDAKGYNNNLLLSICARQMITGEAKDFRAKIKTLKNEKANLEANCSAKIGSVSSDKAGYFISGTDGYEKSFDITKLNKLTLKKLKNIKKSSPDSNVIGKVVTSPEWYIACRISADDSVNLAKLQNLGQIIYVMMPAVTNEKIPVYIYAINQRSKKEDGVLVLACDYMNNYIADARHENIEITAITYNGLKVSKRAIHEDYVYKKVTDKIGNTETKKKKVQGVYVLHGSELQFKQISISYSGSDYVLCNPSPEDGVLFNSTTLELYDQVVIKGDNLYDGKVIA